MFDLERFIGEVRAALAEGGQRAVREVTARAVSDPGAVLAGLGEPTGSGLVPILRSADLTILNVVWAPKMTIMPHNHAMWAVIGVYAGGEDNIFWRRLPEGPEGRVEAAGARSLRAGDCTVLGQDIIHSVTNPLGRLTGAIHIYGGDFFAAERSEWEPETLAERPYDLAKAKAMFGDTNRGIG
jgi:predicted metal-dependent enzyme (double-stranded beta helix superfamily)